MLFDTDIVLLFTFNLEGTGSTRTTEFVTITFKLDRDLQTK